MAKGTKEVEDKDKGKSKLDIAMESLNKQFGKGSVVGGDSKPLVIEAYSTGSLKIDIATGINGLPIGRVVEVYGPESSGKTTLCLHTIANAQKKGAKCAIIDMEHALDAAYATALGVNMENVILSQPDYGEQALEIAHQLIKTGEVGLVFVDSIAALVPKSEVEGEVGDNSISKQARMMSQALRMLTPIAEKHNCLLLFTNQLREKIGVMYGTPEVVCGGNASKYYASMRIDMRKTPDQENELNKTRIKIVKSKVSKPFQTCETIINWGTGFDRTAEVIDLAIEYNIIQKAGSWFSQGETRIGQGIESVKALAESNLDWIAQIEMDVLEKIKENK